MVAGHHSGEHGLKMDKIPIVRTDFKETLVFVGHVMRKSVDPWWIISSAAAALHGLSADDVSDVDILLSERDALAISRSLGISPSGLLPSDLFRSDIFFRWTNGPLPVEFMSNFRVRIGEAWQLVSPKTRVLVPLEGSDLYVPRREELIALLESFGRPKDMLRAERLRGATPD